MSHYRANKRLEEVVRIKRKKAFYVCLMLLFLFFYILISPILGDLGIRDFLLLKKRYSRLSVDVALLEQEKDSLTKRVILMEKGNLFEVEKIARERLDLIQKGDIVFKFID